AVLERRIGAGQGVFEIREAVLAEHRLDDVGHGLLLEDAAIRRPRQKPQPRPELGPVRGVAAVPADLTEMGHVTVQVTRVAVRQIELDAARVAQDVVEREVLLQAQQVELVDEWPSKLLRALHGMKQQVSGERRLDPRGLRSRHQGLKTPRAPTSSTLPR